MPDTVNRIDFHTHILPEMDDGSRSMEESILMLRKSVAQGIHGICLTPHFYADRDHPEHFLKKRYTRFCQLTEKVQELQIPVTLFPGAEVAYFEGITAMTELMHMRIGDSRVLLVEMPMIGWSERMVDDILELNLRKEYRVVLAHIDRYVRLQKTEVLYHLVQNGVLMQCNTSYFRGFTTAGKAIQMLENGLIHLLGSDCHNMTARAPDLWEVCERLIKKGHGEAVSEIMRNGMHLLAEKQCGRSHSDR